MTNIPPKLYRGFDKKEHAEDFVNRGKVRFGSFEYYRSIENQHIKDSTEGTAYTTKFSSHAKIHLTLYSDGSESTTAEAGLMNCDTKTHGFIYCCSKPTVNLNYIRNQLNKPNIVEIETQQFLDNINKYIKCNNLNYSIDVKEVIYNKDERPQIENDEEIRELAFIQKPNKFYEEEEIRFILIIPYPDPSCDKDYIEINLGKPLKSASILKV